MRYSSYESYLRMQALMEELRTDLTSKIAEIFGCEHQHKAIELCAIYSTDEIQAAYHMLWEVQGIRIQQAMSYACDFTKTLIQYSQPIAA